MTTYTYRVPLTITVTVNAESPAIAFVKASAVEPTEYNTNSHIHIDACATGNPVRITVDDSNGQGIEQPHAPKVEYPAYTGPRTAVAV